MHFGLFVFIYILYQMAGVVDSFFCVYAAAHIVSKFGDIINENVERPQMWSD